MFKLNFVFYNTLLFSRVLARLLPKFYLSYFEASIVGRVVKDARLDSREARLKLAISHEPYWRLIHEGLHLGYRKGTRGGIWRMRFRNEPTKHYIKKTLGKADDNNESNGIDILNFKQAQIKAVAVAHDINKTISKPLTVYDAVQHYLAWYKEHRKAYVETNLTINAHILPHFGHQLISALKSQDIKAWLNQLAAQAPRKRTARFQEQQYRENSDDPSNKRSRKATANRILTVLKAILNKAFHDELVEDNTAWRRVKPFENVEHAKARFLNEAECKRLINAARADFRVLLKAALFTGARYSELTYLEVESVNIDTATIYIKISKSDKGRYIPLSADGLDFFKTLIIGKLGNELVFKKQDGTCWGDNHQARLLKDACHHAKIIPAVGFHELRHTYASLLAQAGADLLTISKLLGHADTRITSRHYAHLCDRTLANAVNRLLPSFGHEKERKIQNIV